MKTIIIILILLSIAIHCNAQTNPVASAIANLQVAAGIRNPALSGSLILVYNSLGPRENLVIPGFLPVPEGKTLVITRFDGVPATEEYRIEYYSTQWGSGGQMVFNQAGNWTWTGQLVLTEGGTLEMKRIVGQPPTHSIFAIWCELVDL